MFSKMKKSDFNRNVLTLLSGTTIAQAIPIAISPILTRIYSPSDFGVFALFLAVSSILGTVSNGKYELAILHIKKDENVINMVALGILISVLFSTILLLFVILFSENIVMLFDNETIYIWLYFIPFTTFFMGLYNILSYYNIRKKFYKDVSSAIIVKSIVLSFTQLILGFLYAGALGLISGELLSRLFANMKLFENIYTDVKNKYKISVLKMIALGKRYKQYPLITLWATLFNTLSDHSINLFLSLAHSIVTLGFYSLAERVLGMPLSLIGKSIGQVYFQEASDVFKKKHTIKIIFYSTLKRLILIATPLFLLFYLFIEDIFAFVFGEEWRTAGKYAEILTFLFFARFLVVPFTTIPMIINNVKIDFIFQVGMLFVILCLVTIISILDLDIITCINVISFVYGGYYFVYLYILRTIVETIDKRIKNDLSKKNTT